MQYTLLQSNDVPSAKSPARRKIITTNQSSRKLLMMISILGLLFLGYLAIAHDLGSARLGSSAIESLASSLNLHESQYAIVIDAGSTGTRIMIFTFHMSVINGDFILDDETYLELMPGISSFADDPKKVVTQLDQLLAKAKEVIPKESWAMTPINLRATAGLRLLPENEAEALLAECRKYFNESGFRTSKDSVSLMGGVDEGIYGWFTVNFLMNRLKNNDISNTVAVLDLGGGSTQVTYAPDSDDLKLLDNHIYTVNVFNHNVSLFTNSYLGYGLMAARKAVLMMDLSGEEAAEAKELRSECINPIVHTEWTYQGRDYMVKGPVNASYKIVKTQNYAGTDEKRSIVRVDECRTLIKRHIEGIVEKPKGLKKKEIYGISYYFERAIEAGLVDPFQGGVITLDKFYESALDACNSPNTEQPFTCLDMMYIHILLQDCFGLDGSTKLNLYKKYQGHELSWGLGVAFSENYNEL